MATFEEVYSRLPKETKERTHKSIEVVTPRLETPSMGLNLGLGGGLGYRFITIWGAKSAGKTALAVQTAANGQKQGDVVAFVDAEGSYDPKWAAKLGLDTENTLHTYARSVGRVTDTIVEYFLAGVNIVILDSVSAMVPGNYLDGEELKGFQSTGKIGADAKETKAMLKSINYVLEDMHDKMLIIVSQSSMGQLSSMHWGAVPTNGEALKFYSSQMIRLMAPQGKDNFITEKIFQGDQILERVTGRSVNWKIDYNKLGPPQQTGSYDFYFAGEHPMGIDTAGEVADLGVEYGVFRKSGAWIFYGDEKWQGRANLVKAMHSDEELLEKFKKELYERV
jgi:recombination protein RecA